MRKKKWLGALLNFITPGLGQFYSHRIKKAILIYILSFVAILSLRFIAFSFPLFLLALGFIVGYYLFAAISGYRDVKSTEYPSSPYDKWYVYLLIIIAHAGISDVVVRTVLGSIAPIHLAHIPTPAMDPALITGDRLAYKKTKSIERYDIVLFWYPPDTTTLYVKRCIGLPGDLLQIKKGKVSVNDTLLSDIPLRFQYEVVADNPAQIIDALGQRPDAHSFYQVEHDKYLFFLTKEEVEKLNNTPDIDISPLIQKEGEVNIVLFPYTKEINWTTDHYGPLYIPKKGETITLSNYPVNFYLSCIKNENTTVETSHNDTFINGQVVTSYTFKENYYFVMGDNRHNSADSRYWGFVPQRLIVGKGMYLYWGKTTDRIGISLTDPNR